MEKIELQVSNNSIFEGSLDLSHVYTAEIVRNESYNKFASVVFQALALFEPLFEFSASLVFLAIDQVQVLTKNIKEVIYSAWVVYRDLKLPWLVSFDYRQKTNLREDNQIKLANENKNYQDLNPLLRRLYKSFNNRDATQIPLADLSLRHNEKNNDEPVYFYPTTKITIKDNSGSRQVLVFGKNQSDTNMDQQSGTSIAISDSAEIHAASTAKDFTTLSSIKWGSQDFKEILDFL